VLILRVLHDLKAAYSELFCIFNQIFCKLILILGTLFKQGGQKWM